ncbi:MAG: ABC transporter substrate-binding protein [Myxococcota bacterium]|nr:ABC transporter substrate-binding protein [Myxococcota bacterium]
MRPWLSAAVALALGCSAEVRAPAADRGITVLIESPIDSLDSRFALSAAGQRVSQLITPGLITFDAAAEPIPDLAESFQWVDERTMTFKLRENLRFHDGSSLTSRDVEETYSGLLDPRLGSPRGAKLEAVLSVRALDPRTVQVTLKRPFAPALADLSIGIVPARLAYLPAAQEQERHPQGAGPFRFVRREEPESVVLEPHPGYYGGAPRISRLVIRTVRDETTRLLELLKGRADLVVNALAPANMKVVEDAPGLSLQRVAGTGFSYLGFNLRAGPTADLRVRRALCAALDVPQLARFKFRGLAEPATGMLPRGTWAYAATPGCRRDLSLAGRLLDEAGFPDPDGPGGRPRLTLSYKTSTDRLRRSMAVVLQKQAAEAGIALEIRALEFGTFFSDVRHGNFEVMSLKWVTVMEPDLLRGVFHSSQVPTEQNYWGGWNRGGYSNPRLDGILEEASRVDRPRRQALYAQAQRILDQELPYLPLWHEQSVCVVSRRLAEYRCSTHGFLTPLAQAREVGR